MLDRLYPCQQAGIDRGRAFVFLYDLGALFGDADKCVAGLGLRLFVYRAENHFKPRDMAFRFAAVLFEGLFQIRATARLSPSSAASQGSSFRQSICLLTYRKKSSSSFFGCFAVMGSCDGRCARCNEARGRTCSALLRGAQQLRTPSVVRSLSSASSRLWANTDDVVRRRGTIRSSQRLYSWIPGAVRTRQTNTPSMGERSC